MHRSDMSKMSDMARPERSTDEAWHEMRRAEMARAVEANWCAAWASLGLLRHPPRSLVDDTPMMLRVATPGLPDTLMNIVMRYHGREPVTMSDMEDAIAPFRRYGLPFQWWLIRDEAPAGLREQLYHVGMRSWGGATMMYLPLAGWDVSYPSAAPGVSYGRVTTDAERSDVLRIISRVFDVPDFPMARWTSENAAFTLHMAHWGHQPVATVATLAAGETMGVYHVATLREARRRGIAGNLLLLALRDAQAAGYAAATLTATPEGQHLYTRLGFEVCGLLEQWTAGPHLTDELIRHSDPLAYSE